MVEHIFQYRYFGVTRICLHYASVVPLPEAILKPAYRAKLNQNTIVHVNEDRAVELLASKDVVLEAGESIAMTIGFPGKMKNEPKDSPGRETRFTH